MSSRSHHIILLAILFTISLDASGQRWKRDRQQLIVGLGATGFMGDLGGSSSIGTQGMKDFDISAVRPSIMGGYRYFLLQELAVTGNLTAGFISGNDNFTSEPFRNNRNIHFRSPIVELSGNLQYYFYDAVREGARYRSLTRSRSIRRLEFKTYVFAGLAGFYFNPQGYFDGSLYNGSIPKADLPQDGWYSLRRLNTEGQGFFPTRKKYSPVSVAIPFGLGFVVQMNRELSIGFEYGFRKTFTDYIDDVSTTYVDPKVFTRMFEDDPAKIALGEFFANPTNNNLKDEYNDPTAPGLQRGNPYNNDSYMFALVKVYYSLQPRRPRHGLPRF
jgi:hypothetical protein